MPITLNSFKCPDGHTFEANAKLRTRCPECGKMTKRSFTAGAPAPAAVTEPPKNEPAPITEHPTPVTPPEPKKPVLVRRGKERMPTSKAPAKKEKPLPPKRTLVGSKVSGGLVRTKTVRTRGVVPSVKTTPRKTATARGSVAGKEVRKPFWHDVADRYGI